MPLVIYDTGSALFQAYQEGGKGQITNMHVAAAEETAIKTKTGGRRR